MSSYTEAVARIQDQFLDALERAQDRSVGVVESARRVASGIVPTRLLASRDTAVPPEDVVKLTLGFSERLVAQQRAYAERLVAALDSDGSGTRPSGSRPRSKKAAAPAKARASANSAAAGS